MIETVSPKSRDEEEICSWSQTIDSTDANSIHGGGSECTKSSNDDKSEKNAVRGILSKPDKFPKTSADNPPHLKWEPLKMELPKATTDGMFGTRVESQAFGSHPPIKTVSKESLLAGSKGNFFASVKEQESHFDKPEPSKASSKEVDEKFDFFASIQKESSIKEEDSFWEEPKLIRPSSTRMTGVRGEMSRTSSNFENPYKQEIDKTDAQRDQVCDNLSSINQTQSRLLTGTLNTDNSACSESELNLLLPFHKPGKGSLRYGSPKLEKAEGSWDKADPFLCQHNEQSGLGAPLCGSQMSLTTTAETNMNESVHSLCPISTQRSLLKTAVLKKGKLPRQLVPSSNTVASLKSDCTLLSLTTDALTSQSVKVKLTQPLYF